MSRDEVSNAGTGDETSDARRARRRDEKRGKDFTVKIAHFTKPFLDSESGTKKGVTHLCLPCNFGVLVAALEFMAGGLRGAKQNSLAEQNNVAANH